MASNDDLYFKKWGTGMELDVVPMLIASFIFASLCAPLQWIAIPEKALTIAQIFLIGGLFFVLMVELDYRFSTNKQHSWLPAEALGGF